MNNNDKNKIVGFSQHDLSLITNGNSENIKNISDPNRVGHVEDPSGNSITDITPLIMVINSGGTGDKWKEKVHALISVGADPNMEVNYYNRNTTATELAYKYRNLDLN